MKYDLFISYSHNDLALAQKISRHTRNYRLPASLGLGKRRLSVFRDKEVLTTSPSLNDELRRRIDVSRRILILCSPSSAESPHVQREIQYFLESRGNDFQSGDIGTQIILALVEGDLAKSLPSQLQNSDVNILAESEPLYVDLRNISAGFAPWLLMKIQLLTIISLDFVGKISFMSDKRFE